jgi:two-component system chemotaxis response regulator CheY
LRIKLSNLTLTIADSLTCLPCEKHLPLKKSGFKVVSALSGKIALQEIDKGLTPDLIITDLNMPYMDGFELIEELHKYEKLKDVPIFILTTEFSLAKKIKAKELKITGWIQKPYKIVDFINTVTKALR